MTTEDNVQTGSGAATSEVNYQGLQSILKRDFRIVGMVGAQGQKEQLSYVSLSKQVEKWQGGYSEKELVNGLIKYIVPGLLLKDYLEAMCEMGFETLMKIICAHYQEKMLVSFMLASQIWPSHQQKSLDVSYCVP